MCCKGARGLRARCFFYRSEKVRETAELERLREVVEGVLPEGTELVEARFSGGPLLTVLLDREDGPVDHEFCSRVAPSLLRRSRPKATTAPSRSRRRASSVL